MFVQKNMKKIVKVSFLTLIALSLCSFHWQIWICKLGEILCFDL